MPQADFDPRVSLPIGFKLKKHFYWRLAQFLQPVYKAAANGLCIRSNEKRIQTLHNAYTGKRCFIIGNGPSLNNLDLIKMKGEYTFGVNAIYTNFHKMQFYPTFHVVEDVFVAEDRAHEINAFKQSVKFYGNYLRYCLHPDEKTLLLNVLADYTPYADFPHFSTNALEALYVGGTVSYLCMQLAYFMGFDNVYLVGFDHAYQIPKSLSTEDDVNHFNKDYFGKGKRWHDPHVNRMEASYKKAKIYFEKEGRVIYNATAGGQLEVFDRVNYNTLF